MFFDKLFVLSFVYFLCVILQIFSMAEPKEVLSPTTSMQESHIHTLGQLTRVASNSSCLTPDGKLKVDLTKIHEQKDESSDAKAMEDKQKKAIVKKAFSLSIILVARNKTLESMDFEEEITPKLYVSSTNHVVLQRIDPQLKEVRFNVKQLIKKQIATKKTISGWRCTIL